MSRSNARAPTALAARALAATLCAAWGCGAPVHSAAAVADDLNNNASLADVVSGICDGLAASAQPPNFAKTSFTPGDCTGAGQVALDLSSLATMKFATNTSQSLTVGSDKVQKLHVRVEVWLNRNLLDLAALMSKALQLATTDPSALTKVLTGGGNNSAIGTLNNLVQTQAQLTKAPTYDLAAGRFDAEVNVNVTGAVLVDNTIAMTGALGPTWVAVELASAGDPPPYAKSMLRQVNGLILIVPYAGDTYMDMNLDIEIYSLGFDPLIADSVAKLTEVSLQLTNTFMGSL